MAWLMGPEVSGLMSILAIVVITLPSIRGGSACRALNLQIACQVWTRRTSNAQRSLHIDDPNRQLHVQESWMDNKVLQVGEELLKETLPLQMGSRVYQLEGLKPYSWYEVKISYPASIPAIFSLQLKKGSSDVLTNYQRKLLNTEKLIFKTGSLDDISDQGGTCVLVSVEAEGIVAIPGVQERDTILFNIVCDELLLGLPHKAWPVIILAVLCLALGFILPLLLPAHLLPRKGENHQPDESKHR